MAAVEGEFVGLQLGSFSLSVLAVKSGKLKSKQAISERSNTRLSPAELRKLADEMVAATDPVEVKRLKKELERGFYGDPAHA
jgi:hypothetical protein